MGLTKTTAYPTVLTKSSPVWTTNCAFPRADSATELGIVKTDRTRPVAPIRVTRPASSPAPAAETASTHPESVTIVRTAWTALTNWVALPSHATPTGSSSVGLGSALTWGEDVTLSRTASTAQTSRAAANVVRYSFFLSSCIDFFLENAWLLYELLSSI